MNDKLKDELLNSIAEIIHNLSLIIYKIEKSTKKQKNNKKDMLKPLLDNSCFCDNLGCDKCEDE